MSLFCRLFTSHIFNCHIIAWQWNVSLNVRDHNWLYSWAKMQISNHRRSRIKNGIKNFTCLASDHSMKAKGVPRLAHIFMLLTPHTQTYTFSHRLINREAKQHWEAPVESHTQITVIIVFPRCFLRLIYSLSCVHLSLWWLDIFNECVENIP